jgi:hypothetical protein
MKCIMTKAVVSDWRPAQRFWNIFQVHDPADISPLTVRSPLTAARYEAYYREVRDAPAQTRKELGEKLRIAAAVGLSQLLRFHQPIDDPSCAGPLVKQLLEVMATPSGVFVALVNWPLLEGQVSATRSVEGTGPDTRALLLCNHVAAAGSVWLERLRTDFEALSAIRDAVPPSRSRTTRWPRHGERPDGAPA